MKNKIFGVIGFLGFFYLLGSLGDMEQDLISVAQCLIQFIVGLLIMFLSGHFSGAINYQGKKKIKYRCKNRICNRQLKNQTGRAA